jgi:hypothetical protein
MSEKGKPFLRYLLKGLGFLGAFAFFTLTSLYFLQNKMLYPTGTPIQYPE